MRNLSVLKVTALVASTFGLMAALGGSPSIAQGARAGIRLVFDKTDVSDVLRAISLRTRANIVFPAQTGALISLNITAATTDEALRYVTAAARLTFRQIGTTYVVADPASLRQALEPFGERARITLNSMPAASAVSLLQDALPYLTVRPAGQQVLVIGAPEDIQQAQSLLAEQDRPTKIEAIRSEVVTLQYAAAAQVAAMVKSMFAGLKADPVGQTDKPGGAVGLSGPASQVASALDAVRTVDVPSAPAEATKEYRIYAIKYSSAPALKEFIEKAAPAVTALIGPESYSPPMPNFRPLSGASLGSSNGSGGGSGGLGGGGGGGGQSGGSSFNTGGLGGLGGISDIQKPKEGDRSKSLVLSGSAADLESALKLLDQVDIAPKQIMVDVKVVDTSPERAEELGLKWSWTRFGFYEAAPGTTVDTANSGGIGGDFTNFATRALSFGQFSRVPWSFSSILSGMVSRKEAKLLASPRVQVLENDDANIFIGDTIRSQIVSNGGLNGTNIQIFEFPIGIVLLVRPRINDDGNITMRVHPVVSTITAIDPVTRIPQSSAREAETTVMVKDGETIVIAGLIRDEMSKVVSEVPFLSKLPLVGELFRHRQTTHRHSEIMIFITPHIVK